MPLRRASLILPGHHLEDFPTHFVGPRAAELLSAWSSLWHPAILAATGALPGLQPADSPPDPGSLEGELFIVPAVSRERLPSDWSQRFAATQPRNPPLIEPFANRSQTIAALLAAAAVDRSDAVSAADIIGDFLALGYAYLQVEMLTRAMRYTTLLDANQFEATVVNAAREASSGNVDAARDGLGRSFSLLFDARNHFYSVDFYLVDITLLAETTLGESLRARLADPAPTSLLAPAELIEHMAARYPETLVELRRACDAGAACVVGGRMQSAPPAYVSPEGLLGELEVAQRIYEKHLGRPVEVFAQYHSAFTPLMLELLHGLGFRAALHASFDGDSLPQAEQPKTWWTASDGPRIEALSTVPFDAGQPETWLALASRLSDSLSHDHVATILLAGWPGHASEFAEDLHRVANYSSVLGKMVTLDEYFRVSREVDDWITFRPRDYTRSTSLAATPNPLSGSIDAYQYDLARVHERLVAGLSAAVSLHDDDPKAPADTRVVVNAWSFPRPLVQLSATDSAREIGSDTGQAYIPDVPGCGYATVAAVAEPPPVPLVEGRKLRNEHLEVVISETSGGIQSIRAHGDRGTRASQRLVFADRRLSPRAYRVRDDDATPEADVRMLAEEIEITRGDPAVGEISARGRLTDANGNVLARFTQRVQLPRGLAAVFVDVTLDVERRPEGAMRNSYFASRLVWRGDELGVRRGVDWLGRTASRGWIQSPEWVEVNDGVGTITCFPLGLPVHRLVSATRLDTLLAASGEARNRFQFAIGLDCAYPAQTALALLACLQPPVVKTLDVSVLQRGWFLHASARNVLITHIAPLAAPRSGLSVRLLETEGRDARVTLTAFRPIQAAQITDFRGQATEVISIQDEAAKFDIDPHRWVQVELEW